MGRGILRGAGGDENLKSNFIWPYLFIVLLAYELFSLTEVNPLDYVYQAIGCGISLLEEDSSEAQYILKYIYNSCKYSQT